MSIWVIIECEFKLFEDWENLLELSKSFRSNDNVIVVMSRTNKVSYQTSMSKVATYLNTNFKAFGFALAGVADLVGVNRTANDRELHVLDLVSEHADVDAGAAVPILGEVLQ